MSVSYFKNQHDYQYFNFMNETGADLTVTNVDLPSGIDFDTYTRAQWDAGNKRIIKFKSSETYGLTTTTNSNMFQLRGDTVQVDYTSGDGTKLSHNIPVSSMRTFTNMAPNVVMVMLSWGNPGVPRAYKLYRQRNTINGFAYFMNSTGDVGIYLKLPTSGSPVWVLVHNDTIIAEYRTFMQVNTDVDFEGAVCSFPADASYWASGKTVTGTLPKPRKSIWNRAPFGQYNGWEATPAGDSAGLRVIYFQNKNWRVRTPGVTVTPSWKTMKQFVYRSDRQYFSSGVNGNSKVSGVDTQRHSYIYELGITSELNDNQVMEWEIYDNGTGQFSKFLTQLSSFTIDVNRLGVHPTGVLYTRYRILEVGRELTPTEHSSADNPNGSYGRTGPFTGWTQLPAMSLNVIPMTSSGRDGWLKARPKIYYGDIYSDCGWDTKLNIRSTGPGYTRQHPMIYPNEWVAIGINSSQSGSLQPGTYVTYGRLTHNKDDIISYTTTVVSGANHDPRVWIRDNKAQWGGSGMAASTYTQGYQCCGQLSSGNYTGRHGSC